VAIGFCFGGTTVIELGRAGAELAGIVSFHGGLDSPEPEAGKNITAPVLILHGADDPTVKQADIEAMLDEFNKADVAWTLVAFSDAVHAFTDPAAGKDPSQGAAYNKRAAVESWKIFTMYLERWTR
jgi:dienelactone hydrolase